MNQHTSPPATWLIVLTYLFAAMEIMVSFSIWSNPQAVIETLDATANGVGFLAKMWAVRQLALGAILAFAAFKKSRPMLSVAYLFVLIMFLGDLVIGIGEKQNPLILSAAIMALVAAGLLYLINKTKTS